MNTRTRLIKLASPIPANADLLLAVGNYAAKHRNRGVSQALAERILEGFGKNRKAHQYFRAGKALTGAGTGIGLLGGLLSGGMTGGLLAGKAGAAGLGTAGAALGTAGGAALGARAGFGGVGGLVDAARNYAHIQRVNRLASKLRMGAGAAGAGALGLGGLAAYKKSKGK